MSFTEKLKEVIKEELLSVLREYVSTEEIEDLDGDEYFLTADMVRGMRGLRYHAQLNVDAATEVADEDSVLCVKMFHEKAGRGIVYPAYMADHYSHVDVDPKKIAEHWDVISYVFDEDLEDYDDFSDEFYIRFPGEVFNPEPGKFYVTTPIKA